MNNKGILYIVATPIGNLSDLSQRALEILSTVDFIAAEDTRHSQRLLQHYAINTPSRALHEHNEQQMAQQLLQKLQQGQHIALISDAGTPLISDPGAKLLQILHQQKITVIPIPGPCALIAALSVAGFSADKFVFEGFLPVKAHARLQRLQQLRAESRTLVFYEAPHRIQACVQTMVEVFGAQRLGALVKEISKCHETIFHAPLTEIAAWLAENPRHQKGEFVLVLAGAPAVDKQQLTVEAQQLLHRLLAYLSLKDASQLASEITGLSKKSLYQYGLMDLKCV